MHQMVPRRSINTSHKRRAGAESKNQRNQEALPRAKRERKQAVKKGKSLCSVFITFYFM
jgi:hypothetical protein